MPPRKRTSSVLNGDASDLSKEVDRVTNADDALAEAAEAEAAEAEAVAAAARARARAIRLRREVAATAATAAEPESSAIEVEAVDTPAVDADEDIDADEGVNADEDEAAEKPARLRRRPSKQLLLKVGAAALVVVASLGLLGLGGSMYWHHRNVEAQQRLSAEFAAAARQSVVTLMSLDFNKAEEDVKRILDNTTGDFKKDFENSAQEFVQVAQASKVVTEATVNAVAVQSMTKDTATVLVAVVTRVSNAASKTQEPRSWRLSVDVTRDGDQLKLAKVEFVP